MIPQRPRQQEDNIDSWLMSYADMITLLMCFFIIFVSVSEPKKDKFSRVTQGLASQFGSVSMATMFEGAYQSLQAVVESHQAFRDVAVTKTDRSVEMELATGAFFRKNTADFIPEKIGVLDELVEAFKSVGISDYRIVVEGHTSDVPVNSGVYPTNWELSSARASRVVRYFIDKGIKPANLKAVGFADTDPKVPNRDTAGDAIPENREKNQRMVIKLERPI